MSGVHGLTSAPGARFAVLPAPVRRALLLAALVSGLLVTAWLTASDPVRAQEEGETAPLTHQAASVAGTVQAPATRAATDRPQAAQAAHGHDDSGRDGSGRNGSGQADAARTDTGRSDAGDRPDTASADAGTSVPMAARINDPLVGAVSAVGENTTRMVFDGSAGIPRGTVPETPEVARQLRDTVHGVTEPVEEYLDGDDAPDAEPRTEDPSATPTDTDGQAGAESGAAAPPAPADAVTHLVPTVAGTTPGAVQRHADTAAENAPARLVSDPVATPSGLSGSGSGSAQGAPGGVPAVAGYLAATGAPAPAPGQLQAARHVLLAVPAESADEPTFSPD